MLDETEYTHGSTLLSELTVHHLINGLLSYLSSGKALLIIRVLCLQKRNRLSN